MDVFSTFAACARALFSLADGIAVYDDDRRKLVMTLEHDARILEKIAVRYQSIIASWRSKILTPAEKGKLEGLAQHLDELAKEGRTIVEKLQREGCKEGWLRATWWYRGKKYKETEQRLLLWTIRLNDKMSDMDPYLKKRMGLRWRWARWWARYYGAVTGNIVRNSFERRED